MKRQILGNILITLTMISQYTQEPYCNMPKECKIVNLKRRQLATNSYQITCKVESDSQLRFNKSVKSCKEFDMRINQLILRPKKERSIILEKNMIDFIDLCDFINTTNINQNLALKIELQYFKGFHVNLFDRISTDFELSYSPQFSIYSSFDFYSGEKKLRSCEDFNNPQSILQFLSKMRVSYLELYLIDEKNKRQCPLVFKDFQVDSLYISGENSFFSQRLLSFSNDTFPDLNTSITTALINIPNIELDSNFIHPDVFNATARFTFEKKVKKIHPNTFDKLKNLKVLHFNNLYLKSLMHSSGIDWLINLNRDIVNWDLENFDELRLNKRRIKFVFIDCLTKFSPPLGDIFPDEDFCLYKDFPVNRLVVIIEYCVLDINIMESNIMANRIPCTYLWMTRIYKSMIMLFPPETIDIRKESIYRLLNSSDYKSASKCDFKQRLEICNRSNFKPSKHINTIFEFTQAMLITQTVLNILSYVLSIFGIVTNLLVVITISSKSNKTEFKGIKQYGYLRLNSICNCLILLIHMVSWLNECFYPFQVFCPLIRKTIFMQWFKIIVEETLMTALKFMNNFTYIGFAFNRISLIGKDHNKLVKFMSDLGVKKYIAFSLFISISLSVVKVFEYDINQELPLFTYPISYDYNSAFLPDPNSLGFILNFISEFIDNIVFLLVNLSIDVGMIVKLRETLNEKLEKSKLFVTKAQHEAKKKEGEKALENAKSMIIWNTSLNLLLKSPPAFFSLIYLYYSIVKLTTQKHPVFINFFGNICIDGGFCNMILQLCDLLYFLCISIQLFFYERYDKKFSLSFKRIFVDKTKSKN